MFDVVVNAAEAREEVKCAGRLWADFVVAHGACPYYVASIVLDWLYS